MNLDEQNNCEMKLKENSFSYNSPFLKMDFLASSDRLNIGTYFDTFDDAIQAVKDFQIETRRKIKFVHNDINRRIDAKCISKKCCYRLKIRKASDRRRNRNLDDEKGFVVTSSGPDHTCPINDNIPGMDKMREIAKRIAQDWDLNEYISLKQIIQKEREVRGVTISKIKASRALRLARIAAGFSVPACSSRRKRRPCFEGMGPAPAGFDHAGALKRQLKRRDDIQMLAAVNATPEMILAYLIKKYPKELWKQEEVETILAEREEQKDSAFDFMWAGAKFDSNFLDENKNPEEKNIPPSLLPCSLKPNVLLAITGSVAAVKGPQIALLLSDFCNVRVVATPVSQFFWEKSENYNQPMWELFQNIDPPIEIFDNYDEWGQWNDVGDPVVHIKLRSWADCMVIAPLSANTLAKLVTGVCDNLLTCVVRAWDFSKPLIVCPAMNTHMWEHPLTSQQLQILKHMGSIVIEPVVKTLACGDTGKGGLAPPDQIVKIVREKLIDGADDLSSESSMLKETHLTKKMDAINSTPIHTESLGKSILLKPIPENSFFSLQSSMKDTGDKNNVFVKNDFFGFPHNSIPSHYLMGGLREEV